MDFHVEGKVGSHLLLLNFGMKYLNSSKFCIGHQVLMQSKTRRKEKKERAIVAGVN
jgi:hypothetical protein